MTSTEQQPSAPTTPQADRDDSLTWSDEQYLVAFMRDRERACPLCDYNLRGVTRAACPECGHTLKLDVRMAEPYLTAWITMLVMFCLPAGPGVILLLGTLAHGLPWGVRGGESAVFGYTILAAPLAIATLILRRRLCRLPQEWQWMLAVVPLTINGIIFLWIMSMIL